MPGTDWKGDGPWEQQACRAGGPECICSRVIGDGSLRWFFNICRHRGHELPPAGGSAEGVLIQCLHHAGRIGRTVIGAALQFATRVRCQRARPDPVWSTSGGWSPFG